MALGAGDVILSEVTFTGSLESKRRPFLIIKDLGESALLGLPITSRNSEVSSEWELVVKNEDLDPGSIPGTSKILISKPCVISEKNYVRTYGSVKRSFLGTVLRSFVKWSSTAYYDFFHGRRQMSYVPAAGKMLDEKELFNMIDASLDMWLTAGRFNDAFEEGLSHFLGVKYALTVNSGSSANLLAVSALTSQKLGERRLKEGDEVITVAAGFPTTVAPILQNNLVPVFVDVELGTYNIDVRQIEDALTERTRAVVLAHTLGNPFDIDRVLDICKRYNLWLVEDNCDALGSRYNGAYTGTFGHMATLSFYPAHHMTMGEGGAVVTKDCELYKILLSYRDWGRDCWCPTGKDDTCGRRFSQCHGNLPAGYDHKFVYSHWGYNLKITDWQAAIGLAQLGKVPTFIEKRKENFNFLLDGLREFDEFFILPKATEHSDPSWFGFPLTVKEHDGFTKVECVKYLEERGIGTRQLFAGNMLRQPSFIDRDLKLRIGPSALLGTREISEEHYAMLPNTDTVMKSTFWIGVWPGITREWIEHVCGTMRNFVAALSRC